MRTHIACFKKPVEAKHLLKTIATIPNNKLTGPANSKDLRQDSRPLRPKDSESLSHEPFTVNPGLSKPWLMYWGGVQFVLVGIQTTFGGNALLILGQHWQPSRSFKWPSFLIPGRITEAACSMSPTLPEEELEPAPLAPLAASSPS